MNQKVLVTGGAGFIGSHLVTALLKKGYAVRVLDNFSTGKESNLREFSSAIHLIRGDIRDLETCRRAVDKIEIVFHLAALGSVQRSIDNPIETNQVNTEGTLHLLHAAKQGGVLRFIYASSSSVYGDTEILPKQESMEVKPKSPYAVSKVAAEYYCRLFWELYRLKTVSFRYFNVFGPRQDPNSLYAAVIPRFIRSLLLKQTPSIFGDGFQSRAFTYVENVVHANLLASETQDNIFGESFNIASQDRIQVSTLLTQLQELANVHLPPNYQASRRGEILHSYADISKASKAFQYKPHVSFDAGLVKTFDWFQSQFKANGNFFSS